MRAITILHPLKTAFSINVKEVIHRQLNRWLVGIVAWAIAKPEVQRVIADTFRGNTPMCDVLSEAVRSAVDDSIEDISRNLEIDADDIKDLEKYIEDGVKNNIDDIADEVAEAFVSRLRR